MSRPQEAGNGVIWDYLSNELKQRHDSVGEEIRNRVLKVTMDYYLGAVDYRTAHSVFIECLPDTYVLDKATMLLQLGDTPLPSEIEQRGVIQHRLQKTRKRSLPWTEQEDMRLLKGVSKYGAKDWKLIAEYVGNNRNSSQCNQRWCRALDPQISHSTWTQDEDLRLLRAVEVIGTTNWSQVAKIMTGRTDLQCRYRFLQISRVTSVEADSRSERLRNSTEVHENNTQEILESPQPNASKHKRRNSMLIAPFTMNTGNEGKQEAHFDLLPYYMNSSMQVHADTHTGKYLHRLPPLLFERPSIPSAEGENNASSEPEPAHNHYS